MKDWWLQYRGNIVMAVGVAAGTVLLVVVLLAIMALGGVWGPGWIGDVVEWLTG